ncbi:hypothetical protein GCM10023144_15450 [Pigmentiphaga soli]|uniref:Uncharacterized protein n=1 Tax=Pigmentiphaga soli TaxID=1007095 RepID=A0ABP8GRT8_9BURK
METVSNATLTVHDAQRIFVAEAALLDEWRLAEWMRLLTDDARYLVPPLDAPDADPRTALFLVADTPVMLRSRVEQLMGKVNWAENPRSRTRRLVTNVRVLEAGADTARAAANFAVWQFAHGQADTYVGRYVHTLKRVDGDWLIQERRAMLDMEALRPHGKLSFIL